MIQAFYLVNCRSLRHSIWSLGLFRNGWLWLGIVGVVLLQTALTYVPFFNVIFQTTPIGWGEWLRILGASITGVLVVEFQKWLGQPEDRRP
jgi:Ca2+-transporting ATPase